MPEGALEEYTGNQHLMLLICPYKINL